MKKFFLLVVAATAGIMFFSGCGKTEQTPPGTPPPQAVNATDFRPAFATASPETKAVVDQVMMDIQSSLYPSALNGLAKLAANPALNETQKKAVNELTDQLKHKMAAVAAPPK